MAVNRAKEFSLNYALATAPSKKQKSESREQRAEISPDFVGGNRKAG
jgi:hypothetical protein